ncbi:acyltransferase family protein [Streptomyces bambusae]|uniref:acyltransferase family protein n=1 Tax=Streptomyces bambusae TaxID=1550616 RepID=UPI001CFF1208|nr:acyltransferase family protein [Streptomyces bambusae]MCB5163750.1 acyltransferase family protein [Streptomyces bambusae]
MLSPAQEFTSTRAGAAPGATATVGAAAATAVGAGAHAPVRPVVQRRAAPRDPYFDNVKYLTILLVALGHIWPYVVEGSRATRALYMFVYTFHMPVFILISGYLSRSYSGRPEQVRRLLTGVALPYVVFEVAYTLFARWGTGHPEKPISLLTPFYLMWFLIALFIWRLTTPLWRAMRWPLAVSLVVAAAALVTPGIGPTLDLVRVLQFLPFFVLGLCMKPEHFQFLRRRASRVLAALVFVGALPFTYWVTPSIPMNWVYRSRSVQEMGHAWLPGLFRASVFFCCTLVLVAAFLALVPARRHWFTVLGAGTICGYVLHGFLVRGAQYTGFFEAHPWLATPGGRVVVTVGMTGIMTLLCTPPVRRVMKCVTEPEMKWAFRRDAGEPAGRR